jgi:hypothetical protein
LRTSSLIDQINFMSITCVVKKCICLNHTCFGCNKHVLALLFVSLSVSHDKLYDCPRFLFLCGVVQHCVSVHCVWDNCKV